MTTLRTAAQQALEALESGLLIPHSAEVFTALRAALAEPVQEPQLKRIHPLDMPLEVFVADLSTRPRNIINAEMGYFTYLGDEYIKPPFTVRHLLMFSRKEICKWPNLGKRSLNEIEELLRSRGLQLWHEHDERSLRLLREHPTYFWASPSGAALAEPPTDWEAVAADQAMTIALMKAEPVQEPPCATRECMPSQCPNCASLEAQNTELDQKLADIEQTSLELCEVCGWKTLIPGDCCLNCERKHPLGQASTDVPLTVYSVKKAEPVQEPVAAWENKYGMKEWEVHALRAGWMPAPPQRLPLTEEEIGIICASLGFAQISPVEVARAIERAHGIE